MSLAPHTDPLSPAAAPRAGAATGVVWAAAAGPRDTGAALVGLAAPSHVLRATPDGRVDLASLGCAHRVTAIAFTPGPGCRSVTLREALDTTSSSRVAEYRVRRAGFVDLYTVGWAARTAEVVFNR
jgi:hypothetical protein